MRILYVTPAFHHPSLRGPTRCYHFTRELAARHRITLLSLSLVDVTDEAMAEMSDVAERVVVVRSGEPERPRLARLLGRVPGFGGRLATWVELRHGIRRMRRVFRSLVASGGYDVLLFHGKCVAQLLDEAPDLPTVIDFCDATSMRVRVRMRSAPLLERPLLWLRLAQVRRVERRMLRRGRRVAYVSSRDREAIVGREGPGEIVSIGVDHGFWRRRSGPSGRPSIVFTGIMSYAPNEDAALALLEDVLPLVRRSVPDAEVTIVGRDPSPRLRQRATAQEGVRVTGTVDDVRPYLEQAAVVVVPMRFGSGVQNKVLEALSMGVPVVTTPLVAEGLRVEGAEPAPVVVADRPAELADRVTKLLGHADERARLAACGRRYVEQYFDWGQSAARLERICEEAVAEARTDELER